MNDALEMWTIYDHPRDHPNHYVARKFRVSGNQIEATKDLIVMGKLDNFRAYMKARGKVNLGRFLEDDPVIVETWV